MTSERIKSLLDGRLEKSSAITSEQASLFGEMEFLSEESDAEQENKSMWMFISPEEAGQ